MKDGRLFIHPNNGWPKYWVRWEEHGVGCGTSYGKARGAVWTRADHEGDVPYDKEVEKEKKGYRFIAPISEKQLGALTGMEVFLSRAEKAHLEQVRASMLDCLELSADLRSIDRALSETAPSPLTLEMPVNALTDW